MPFDRTIDDTDRHILTILQNEARTSNAEISRQVGMAASGVFERIRKLEESNVIGGYRAAIDSTSLGLGLLAFVFVKVEEDIGSDRAGHQLADIAGVQEVHHIAGEDCYLVKIRAADTESLGRMLREKFGAIPAVKSTRTTIVLQTLKESSTLPIPTGRDTHHD
jgi:Lrp/AsnC family leucine-responsive transcriptional regulator